MKMTYSEKLKTPAWQKKRLEILQRDKFTCTLCGATERQLQVHHVVYQRREPWDYPDDLYQTFCVDCHAERTELLDKSVDALRIALKPMSNERLAVAAQRIINAAMEELAA